MNPAVSPDVLDHHSNLLHEPINLLDKVQVDDGLAIELGPSATLPAPNPVVHRLFQQLRVRDDGNRRVLLVDCGRSAWITK